MANVRCPMCSKLNPPEAETCAYCGARIKPASGSQATPPAGSSGDDEPEWLRQLRQERQSEQPEKGAEEPQPGASGDDEPDWLARIRDRARSETGEIGGEEPDWMKGLGGGETAQSDGDDDRLNSLLAGLNANEPASSAKDASSDEDWLSKLSDWNSGEPTPPAAGGAEAAPASPDESTGFGLTGFLSNLEQPDEEPAPSAEEADLGWAAPEQPVEPQETSAGFGLTGFLSAIEGRDAPQEASEIEPDETASVASADEMQWLQGLEKQSTPTAADDEVGLPDWLRGDEPAQEQPLTGQSTGDLPAWLSGSDEPAAETSPTGGTEPDWLASFGVASGEPSAVPESPEPSAGLDLPPWLNDETAAPVEGAAKEEPLTTGAEGLPDWFASFYQADVDQTQPRRVSSSLNAAHEADEPAASEPAATEPAAAEPEGTGLPLTELPVVEPAGEVPDWLQAFQSQGAGEEDQDEAEPGPQAVSPLFTGEEAESEAQASAHPFTMDLPAWLDEDAAAKAAEAGEHRAEPAGEELAQADLPEWVKEMRPIDSMIPAESQMVEMDQRVEKAGPLAGMRGVLPAEELVTRWRRLPVYSVKLRVTEKQRSQSALFESILNQESQPLLIPHSRAQGQGLLLRALIALLLVVALTIPFLPIINVQPLGVPVLYPAEMLDMFETIDQNLQSQAPVLLAVDYQPGLSREMSMASEAVIQQLMAKNARIVVISTVPTGPALAQQLLDEAGAAHSAGAQTPYNLAEQTINLGFLPGGSISLLEFAQRPQRAAPSTLSGAHAWDGTFLKDISGLTGFSQVVVITDSGETGRAWIEQVKPWMGDVPLFMITSAQAAPMLTPYLESNQIDGMVSGLLGGAMYARLANQTTGAAFDNLAAYQVGIVLAMILILVGGLVSGVLALMKRNNKQED